MVNLFTTELETENEDENIKYFMDKHLEVMKSILYSVEGHPPLNYFDEDEEANVSINESQNTLNHQVKKREYKQKPKINIVLQQPAQQATSPRCETFEDKYYGQLSNKNLLR